MTHGIKMEHRDVAENDLAVGRGGTGGGKRAAMIVVLGSASVRRADRESGCLPAPWAWLRDRFEEIDLNVRVGATISIRSIGRPSNFAPAAAAPSAMPFISRRYSAS